MVQYRLKSLQSAAYKRKQRDGELTSFAGVTISFVAFPADALSVDTSGAWIAFSTHIN